MINWSRESVIAHLYSNVDNINSASFWKFKLEGDFESIRTVDYFNSASILSQRAD